MFEKGQAGIPKPAELDRQWLQWNDAFLRLLNRNPRRAATVLAGAWELLPEDKAIPGAALTPDCNTAGALAPQPTNRKGNRVNAIKAVNSDGTFVAQAIRFGSPAEPDRSQRRDFFTGKTELMIDAWAWPRPILLEHGVLPGTFGVVLGQWLSYEKRADGIYLRGRLDTQHPMYAQIKRDIDQGLYFVSSDGAPHLVKRRPGLVAQRRSPIGDGSRAHSQNRPPSIV